MDGAAETAEGLTGRYGDLVEISLGEQAAALLACTIDDCGTIGGSGASAYSGTTRVVFCTTAFLAKWGTSSVKMLTAGHCIQGAGGLASTNKWRQDAEVGVKWMVMRG